MSKLNFQRPLLKSSVSHPYSYIVQKPYSYADLVLNNIFFGNGDMPTFFPLKPFLINVSTFSSILTFQQIECILAK